MALAATISRYLLGAFFTFFGLNGFLHFMPIPLHPGLATRFIAVLVASNYMVPVFLVQLAGGLILLSGRYVALGLTLLAPVLFNILTFHLTMDPGGLPPGAIATVLWLVVAWSIRPAFRGLLERRFPLEV